ncbi:MAG: glycosyltransferase [Endomicrobiia bacterium]
MLNTIYNFSVLMPVYKKDNPLWLKEAIESIINQTVKPSQIVLVIDGPIGKDLEEVISIFIDKLDIFRLKENSGLGIALKKGLEICKYPLVARMDSDDISVSNRFELQLNIFKENPELSITGGYVQEIDCNTKKNIAIRKVPLSNESIKQYIKFRSPFNHPSVMFKKNDILKVNSYQPFYFLEDYYLWIRMVSNNFQMANIEEILVKMRVNKNLYIRRGGYQYFKSNKMLCKEMLKLGILNYPFYLFNIIVRFMAQVLMTNKLRKLLYSFFLR